MSGLHLGPLHRFFRGAFCVLRAEAAKTQRHVRMPNAHHARSVTHDMAHRGALS